MKTYYYEFADGYYCYYCGKPSIVDIRAEERKHGKVVKIKEGNNGNLFKQTV